MTINPARFGSGKRRPMMFNIRLKRRGAKPTADDVVRVLEYMLANQRVPRGWAFAIMNWRDPQAASTRWHTGKLKDFAIDRTAERNLGRVIEAALANARIAIVRQPKHARVSMTRKEPGDTDD